MAGISACYPARPGGRWWHPLAERTPVATRGGPKPQKKKIEGWHALQPVSNRIDSRVVFNKQRPAEVQNSLASEQPRFDLPGPCANLFFIFLLKNLGWFQDVFSGSGLE